MPPAIQFLNALYCFALLALAFFAGLYRLWENDAVVVGTWLGIVSGMLWTAASLASVNWPELTKIAGVLNALAAICATGTVCYLIPDSEVGLVRAAIGLR